MLTVLQFGVVISLVGFVLWAGLTAWYHCRENGRIHWSQGRLAYHWRKAAWVFGLWIIVAVLVYLLTLCDVVNVVQV